MESPISFLRQHTNGGAEPMGSTTTTTTTTAAAVSRCVDPYSPPLNSSQSSHHQPGSRAPSRDMYSRDSSPAPGSTAPSPILRVDSVTPEPRPPPAHMNNSSVTNHLPHLHYNNHRLETGDMGFGAAKHELSSLHHPSSQVDRASPAGTVLNLQQNQNRFPSPQVSSVVRWRRWGEMMLLINSY
jgi:hypothetical protein